nr:major histocompatibility complex, class II alpha chain, WA_02 precusor [Ambystoma tigrinum]
MNSLPAYLCMCILTVVRCQEGSKNIQLAAFTSTDSPAASNLTLDLLADTVVAAYYDGRTNTFQIPDTGLKDTVQTFAHFFPMERVSNFHQMVMKDMCMKINCSDPVSVFPEVQFYIEAPVVLGQENRLLCFLKGFFPPEARVSFLKNGQPFPGQMQSSELIFGRNWTFQVLKYILVKPQDEDTYSCIVEHGYLQSRQNLTWGRPVSLENKTHVTVLIVGLTVGFLGFVVGLILCIHGKNLKCLASNPYQR